MLNLTTLFERDPPLKVTKIAVATGLALFSLSLTTILLGAWKRKRLVDSESEGLKEIPSPKGALPFFGHVFQLHKDLPVLKFDEWHKTYGPIFRIDMGSMTWVIVGDRYVANDILKGKGTVTSARPYFQFNTDYHALGGRGIAFANPDKRWKRSRAIAHSLIGPKGIIVRLTNKVEQEATRITELVLKDTARNGHVNALKYMQLSPLNVILETCFGVHGTSVDDPLIRSAIYYTELTLKLGDLTADTDNFIPAVISKLFDLLTTKKRSMNTREFKEDFIYNKRNPFFRKLIQDALEKKDNDCFVKEIYKVKQENEFEDDDILIFMVDMVIAGTDPTAITLSWAMVILCCHKDVQKRIQDEIDSFIVQHGRLPSFEEREHFPFLLSVQKECMRYRPTNQFALPHEATEDFEYNGYYIRKGTLFLSNTYTMSLNPDHYQNPQDFIPDRFLDDLSPWTVSVNAGADQREQFAFGYGRRLCPGVHLAEVTLFNVWTRIFAIATVEPPLDPLGKAVYPNLNARYDAGLVVAPQEPHVRFVERPDRRI